MRDLKSAECAVIGERGAEIRTTRDDAMSPVKRSEWMVAMAMAALLFAAPACAGGWWRAKKKGPKGPVAESLATYLQRVNALGATRIAPARA